MKYKGVVVLGTSIIGGLLAFLGGAAVSWLNYRINLRTLEKKPSALASISILRQLLSVGYLVAVFLLSGVLPWGHVPLLVGAALGLTIPSILLSLRLARINDSRPAGAEPSSGKGEDPNE